MDTFECYCRNKWDMTTINKAAATVLRQAQQPCDSPTQPHPGCRVSYHGNCIIHSRIENADIQDF